MTITHGILTLFGMYDNLIHEMKEITENDSKSIAKKVNWKETKVFDNSNRGRYQKLSIYRGKWR